MKNWLRIIPPLFVLTAVGGVCAWLWLTKPEPERWPRRDIVPQVAVRELVPVDYQVWLRSQGTVQARTESTLVSEVRGRVLQVSSSLRAGGFFEAGDVLLEIDPRDYQTEVVVAEAALAQAELRLAEEIAAAEQAALDWRRLQNEGEASSLVLREPQLKQAEAMVNSARARLENARLNLERTRITAPYAGRVLSKTVDVGQYVSPGNVLARIYAVDYAEVRLPLSERQVSFMDLEEAYRGEDPNRSNGPKVFLTWELGRERHAWEGRIVRAEGAIDSQSRQLFVVAQVEDPYGKRKDGLMPLKVGSFVQARIEGRLLHDRIVIPRELYRRNEYALVVTPENKLERRALQVEWSDEDNLVVVGGLRAGERLGMTMLNFPVNGMAVIPAPVAMPSTLVRQVVINLLLNAVQAAPRGARVTAGFRPEQTRFSITISNEGSPMDKGTLDHLFEPYYSRREGGSGLGLWVTYQIVQQLGGQLQVVSHENETRFSVTLPLPTQEVQSHAA